MKEPIRHGTLYAADLNPRRGTEANLAHCEVMIDQSRTIDNARLKRCLGLVPRPILDEIKAKLRTLADL